MIPIIRPAVAFEEVEADLRAIFESGTFTNGERLADFEAAVADAVGVEHAVATTSATTAMHLVLAALGIGPDDDVLVSDFTFPATGNVVVSCGARPVLVDVAPTGFRVDLASLEAAVTPATTAAILVDPFTGAVLSMACRPHLDRDTHAGNWRNIPISDAYEPGSVM